MRRLVAVVPMLAVLAGATASQPPALQSAPEELTVNWRGYSRLPFANLSPGRPASLAVDSEGIAHVVQYVENQATSDFEIQYSNTRFESRDAEGFSEPVRIDGDDVGHLPNQTSVADPDIWVDRSEQIHVVWMYKFNAPNPANSYAVIKHKVMDHFGNGTTTDISGPATPKIVDERPQVAVDSNGTVHVVAERTDSVNPAVVNKIIHCTRTASGAVHVNSFPGNPNPVVTVRLALQGKKLCAVWHEISPQGNNDVFYSTATYAGSGTTSWAAKTALTWTGIDQNPDVDFDSAGVAHFAWAKKPLVGRPHIWYQPLGGTAEQVSTDPETPPPPAPPDPDIDYSGGARIRLLNNEVHVIYRGISHASSYPGSSEWRRKQPINKARLAADAMEVSKSNGRRFDVLDGEFYTRTYETIPDGSSLVSVFPGASVNAVPLDGSLKYRLKLFGTSGVGPCTSMGLSYDSSDPVSTLLGRGWTMDHLMHVVAHEDDGVTVVLPNGISFSFAFKPGEGMTMSEPGFGFLATLAKIGSAWDLSVPGGRKYKFNALGKLDTITDLTGNQLKVNYDIQGRAESIVDMLGNGGSGRSSLLEYGTGTLLGRITAVVDPQGARYELKYDQYRRLSGVVFAGVPERPAYGFEYNVAGLLSKVLPPKGNLANPPYGYSIDYDPAGRVSQLRDPVEFYLTETDPDGPPTTAQEATVTLSYNQPDVVPVIGAGKYNTKVVDRRGKPSVYVFDVAYNYAVKEFWDPTAYEDTAGVIKQITRTFDSFGNVLTETDRWGFLTKYTYLIPPGGAGSPALWLRNLVEKVEKPQGTGLPPGTLEEVESFTYTAGDLGLVATRTTRATPAVGGPVRPRTTSFDYNAEGQLLSTTFPDVTEPAGLAPQIGVIRENQYNGPRRQLTRSIDEEGGWTDFANFHPLHGLAQTSIRNGDTQSRETRFDRMGNVLRSLAPQGGPGNDIPGWTYNLLDGLYRVVQVQDPAGKVTTNTYDIESRLVSVLPPAGGVVTTTYDKRGFVTGGSSPDGSWTQYVDAGGNVRGKSSLRGHFTYTDYDSLGRVKEVRAPGLSTLGSGSGGGGLDMRTQWIHDGFENLEHCKIETRKGLTAATDRVTKTFFDNRGRAVRVEGADDQATKVFNVYDEQDQLVATHTTWTGIFQTASVNYRDDRDRVYRVRVQNAAYPAVPSKFSDTTTLFNKAGSVLQTVGPKGDAAAPGYAHKVTNIIDSRQRVVMVVDGKGLIVRENIWGDDDQLSEVRVPDPATKSGDLVRSETRTYTARKELKTVRNRENVGLTYAYNDLPGQVNTVTDALGRITKTTYDVVTQRVDEVIAAWGTSNERRTKNVWTDGLLAETRVWNPASLDYTASYKQFYDQADRLERFEAPLVAAEVYGFNVLGDASKFVAGDKTIDRDYDKLGRNVGATWSGGIYSVEEWRGYNGLGQLESVGDGTLEKSLVADVDLWQGTPNYEIFRIGTQAWKIQTHQFDPTKSYETFIDAQNGEHGWLYDENNRVREATYKPAGGAAATVYRLTYTPGGLVDTATCHDAAGGTLATSIHSYDTRGRKIRVQTLKAGTSATLSDFEWEYNDGDLVWKAKIGHLGIEIVYGYNERNELTSETTSANAGGQALPADGTQLGGSNVGLPNSAPSGEAGATPAATAGVGARTATYVFDKGGNRTSQTIDGVTTSFTYNAASQLVMETAPGRSVSHLYDQWGNEVRRTTTQGTSTQEDYGYNHLNLLSVYTNSTTPSGNTQYAYWPTGERYEKLPTAAGASSERYVPRAGDVGTEYDVAAGGGAETFKNAYVQGTGIDQKYVRVSQTGQGRRHYLGDQVGTVSITLTDSGVVQDTTLRDAWGVLLPGFSSAPERYGYAQREHDQESGLVHMRARQYDPRLGRFLQTDPVLGNRSTEHYAYAMNNPVSQIDPMGLWTLRDAWDGVKQSWRTVKAIGRATVADPVQMGKSVGSGLARGYVVGSEGFTQGVTLGLYQAPPQIQKETHFNYSRSIGTATTIAVATVGTAGSAAAVAGGTTTGVALAEWSATAGMSNLAAAYSGGEAGAVVLLDAIGVVALSASAREAQGEGFDLANDLDPMATMGILMYGAKEHLGRGGPYKNLKDHPSVGPGKPFTRSQHRRILEANRKSHDGVLTSDKSGVELVQPRQHQKGVTPPGNEAHIDHRDPKSRGGTNSFGNADVLSRDENLDKSDQ